ncbi:MAG: alpha/beta fold hydrolase [Gaiellaceae bacterium]
MALSIIGAAAAASGVGPKGRFKADGHKLYLACAGSGRPVVVLDAGLGSDRESWPFAARSARRLHTRVCAYDRYGLGRSDGARSKLRTRTIGAAAADLRALLRRARLKAPYVFVSHSIAGLVDREFARRYPSQVAGMVQLDTAPDDWDIYTGYTGKRSFSWGHERLNVTAASAALRASDSLGAKPLVVIEAGNTLDVRAWASGKSDFQAYWDFAQRALARISSNSIFAVAKFSNHEIPVNAPEIVDESARLVLSAVRAHSKLPACTASKLPKIDGVCDAA